MKKPRLGVRRIVKRKSVGKVRVKTPAPRSTPKPKVATKKVPGRPQLLYRSEGEVFQALQKTYDPNANAHEWAVIPSVRDGAGVSANREADAILFNGWPSRGLEVYGVEIKVSRSDWLQELADPAKVETGAIRFCDRWYVAVGDPRIIHEGELPPTWGLMVPAKGMKMRISKVAPKLPSPKPLARGFVFSALRRVIQTQSGVKVTQEVIAKAVEAERDSWIDLKRKTEDRLRATYDRLRAQEKERYDLQLEGLKSQLSQLSEAIGIDLDDEMLTRPWSQPGLSPAKVGMAIKFLLDGGMGAVTDALRSSESALTHHLEDLRLRLASLDENEPEGLSELRKDLPPPRRR